jgi:tRNA nucleotidyltransferase/poly(A) polymerase
MATGDWVRDKYLGTSNDNISIIINSDKEEVTA